MKGMKSSDIHVRKYPELVTNFGALKSRGQYRHPGALKLAVLCVAHRSQNSIIVYLVQTLKNSIQYAKNMSTHVCATCSREQPVSQLEHMRYGMASTKSHNRRQMSQ
ncbi:hypothetical protein J6590_016239 [Homalodisca vitripennis]|nr:hypothetical protein J6590_016239 [Homalodisca vitripennis]